MHTNSRSLDFFHSPPPSAKYSTCSDRLSPQALSGSLYSQLSCSQSYLPRLHSIRRCSVGMESKLNELKELCQCFDWIRLKFKGIKHVNISGLRMKECFHFCFLPLAISYWFMLLNLLSAIITSQPGLIRWKGRIMLSNGWIENKW